MLKGRITANILWLILFAVGVVLFAFATFISGVLFEASYNVQLALPEAGGVLPGQEVTVLGRSVGIIEDVELSPVGVTVTLAIEDGQSVPSETSIVVLRRSPIGEQAIDFRPTQAGWTPVTEGTLIDPVAQGLDVTVPEQLPLLLERANDLFTAIDLDDLGIVIHEFAVALDGRSETLKKLNRDSLDLNRTLVAGLPQLERLIDTSRPVLDTLYAVRFELADLFVNGAEFGEVLTDNRPNLEILLVEGRRALTQLDAFFRNTRANLTCVFDDLDELNKMLTGPSTYVGSGTTYTGKLDELERGIVLAPRFFLGFDVATQWQQDIGVTWARIKLILDADLLGEAFIPRRPTPTTLPGGACETVFGTGVNAIRQASYGPAHPTGGIDFAPLVEPSGPGTITPPDLGDFDDPLPATGGGALVLAPLVALLGAVARRRS